MTFRRLALCSTTLLSRRVCLMPSALSTQLQLQLQLLVHRLPFAKFCRFVSSTSIPTFTHARSTETVGTGSRSRSDWQRVCHACQVLWRSTDACWCCGSEGQLRANEIHA